MNVVSLALLGKAKSQINVVCCCVVQIYGVLNER